MTKKNQDRIIKFFAVLFIIFMILSTFAGGLLTML